MTKSLNYQMLNQEERDEYDEIKRKMETSSKKMQEIRDYHYSPGRVIKAVATLGLSLGRELIDAASHTTNYVHQDFKKDNLMKKLKDKYNCNEVDIKSFSGK